MSYAFSDDKRTVAIGYTRGILVCSVPAKPKGGAATALRSFYGHAGYVTCVDISQDASWLVSGSSDGTICAWRLRGMNSGNELGLRLQWDAARKKFFVREKPDPASLAWEAGFDQGQYLDIVRFRDQQQSGWWKELGGSRIYTINSSPGVELAVTVRRGGAAGGKAFDIITPVSHDPLYTFYPQRDGDWFLYSPQGYFLTKEEGAGLSRLQWVVNLSPSAGVVVGETRQLAVAELHPGPFFQGNRNNVDILAKVIDDRTPAPIRSIEQQQPLPPSFHFDISADGRTVRLSARPNGPEPVSGLEMRINGLRLTPKNRVQRTPNSASGTWDVEPALLRAGRNDLVAVATIVKNNRPSKFATVHALNKPGPPPESRRIHFLGVGVEQVVQAAELKLNYTEDGALELAEVLSKINTSLGNGPKGDDPGPMIQVLVGPRATTKGIKDALAELGQRTEPEDLAIVMLSGHGVVGKGGAGFRLITRDANPNDVKTGLTGLELHEAMGKLKCRSLLLLDTCYAERAGIDQQLDSFPDRSIGPMLMASCRGDQKSVEAAELGLGAFTASILESLDGKYRGPVGKLDMLKELDGNGDGWLSLGELCRYVRRRTPVLAKGVSNEAQNPTILPSVAFRDFNEVRIRPLGGG